MKQTIELTHPKIKYPRQIEAVKNKIRKYIKRERRKELPEKMDFWDFDCTFGDTQAEAQPIHLSEIDAKINSIETRNLTSFYIEIIAKPAQRAKKKGEGTVGAPLSLKSFSSTSDDDAE